MSDDAFQRMLDIHTVVPFRVIRAAAPHLREPAKAERERGEEVFRKIVNVSSISGTMGNAGQANYSAGKSAVVGLTKTLAKEWGQFKINVNAVAFGWIETRLTASKVEDNTMEIGGETVQLGIPDQMRGMASMLIPLGRTGHAGGGRRRRLLPVLAVVELRPRPGPQHHRRAVHRDDDLTGWHYAPGHEGRASRRAGSRHPAGRRRRPRDLAGDGRGDEHLHGRVPRARGRPVAARTTTTPARAPSTCCPAPGGRWGDHLEQTVTIGPGDMVYVPPRETHLLQNLSDAEAEYVVARDSPTEDSVEVPGPAERARRAK